MVSFSQPQRLATDRSAAAKTLKNPSWYQGLSVGIPSAVAGLPSDLFAITQDDAMIKALQSLGILGPTKQDVVDRVVNTGLLNIDDQEAFNLGTGLASDLLAPGLPFAPSGAARAARAIDNVVPEIPSWADAFTEAATLNRLQADNPYAMNRSIFVGESGAPINRTADLERAQYLERTGSTKDYIWRETGWGRGVDGQWRTELDDSAATVTMPERPFSGDVTDVLQHPEFDVTRNYLPPGAEQQVKLDLPSPTSDAALLGDSGPMGWFTRAENRITLPARKRFDFDKDRYETIADPAETKSILLHELQHKAQELDMFGRGGNPATAVKQAENYYGDEITKIEKKLGRSTDDLLQEQGKLQWQYQRLADIDDVLHYENITKPRFLFNTGEYYKYSNDIAREFGKMPARHPARGEWLEKAGRYIADKKIAQFRADGDLNFERYLPGARKDRKAVKNAMRRAQYALDKLPRREMFELQRLRARQEELRNNIANSFTDKSRDQIDFDTYQRLAGEVEARNVQKRMDFSADERRQTPPWQTQDIEDEYQIIVRE
jgi:hypothetical protein